MKHYDRRDFLKMVSATACLAMPGGCLAVESKASRKPNIIVIIADDMGYRDLGCYGAKDILTPHLDKLAETGTRFTDAYATQSVCAPSRAGLLTGRYQQSFGFNGNVQFTKHGLPVSEKTLAATLKHYGYSTALIGKWHLGSLEKFHPLNRGFDKFYGHMEGMRAYYTNSSLPPEQLKNRNLSDPVIDMRKEVEFEGYITDVFSEKTIDFISRNKDKPFFVTLSYNAPHSPIHIKQPEKYMDRVPEGGSVERRNYAACVSAIDEGVGGIVEELKKQKIYENTMIFFVSDNGGVPWANYSSNGELFGIKGTVYEGGIRIPFIFHWGKAKVEQAAVTQPVSTLDIFSTVMAAVDPAYKSVKLDGVNLLEKDVAAKLIERPLFWSRDGDDQLAIRLGNYKLIQLFDYELELYDLSASIVEDYHKGVSLAGQRKEQTKKLIDMLRKWRSNHPKTFVGGRSRNVNNMKPEVAKVLRKKEKK